MVNRKNKSKYIYKRKNNKKKNSDEVKKEIIEDNTDEIISDNINAKDVDEAIDNLFDIEKTSVLMPAENMPIDIGQEEEKIDEISEESKLDSKEVESINDSTDVISENEADNKIFKNKIYYSYNMRLLINALGIFVFAILAIIMFVSSISIKARSSVLYRQNSNLDYKVYLKQNDYYKEPYLQKNMQYIASLIDNVDVNFNYNFSVNQNINYRYTYYVKADVAVTSSEDKSKVIYSKTDRLTEPSTIVKDNSNGFNINQNIKINYAEYNNLVKAFKSSYAINANSNLILSLLVEIEDEKGNKIKSLDKDAMSLTIPLTEQMIDISMDYDEVNNTNNVNIYKDFNISNKVTFVLSIISFILSLVFIVRLLLFIKKTTVKKTIYDVTLSKILREYDRVIVNSKKVVDLNSDVIDVKNFSELLDVRDNLEKPIIFSEIHKGQKSIFIVKTSNETYRYILKLADLEEENIK